MKSIEKIANGMVVIAVVVFLAMAAHYLFHKSSQAKSIAAMADALRGKTIEAPGLSFLRERASVLQAISTQCHYCEESLPFYRDLAAKAQGKVDVIAVMPQPLAEAQAFLQKSSFSPTGVVFGNLSAIGVPATPTILFVDPHGKVLEAWIGFQDAVGRQKVLARVLQ